MKYAIKIGLPTFLILMCLTLSAQNRIQKVGEEVILKYESPHPYQPTIGDDRVVWRQEITLKDASYIAVHFKEIQLSNDDFILVKSPDGKRSWKYTNQGNSKKGVGFWGIPIYGNTAIVEIYSYNPKGNYGFLIDKVARGYTIEEQEKLDMEAICGQDDSRNARCYQSSEPSAYNESRAVARLMINGTGACTGWLVGSEGHIMTNNHCVESAAEANNVSVEFMAEGASCSSSCQSWFGCPGTVVATSTMLVQTDVALDYSLLRLPSNVSGTYGYMQFRASGPVANERIYIPQHPQAWGKRISILSDNSNDGGFARINTLTSPSCSGAGNSDVGYYADTQGGSSGSPVLGYNDDLVVALHHCAYCPNRGVAIDDIIADLGNNLPHDALGGNNCPSTLMLSGIVSNTENHHATSTINSTQMLTASANVEYKAGSLIVLRPGFTANNGADLLARIETCNNLWEGEELMAYKDDSYDGFNEKYDSAQQGITPVLGTQEGKLHCYPNPFSQVTAIIYQLYNDGPIRLTIHDLNGRLVTVLEDKEVLAGEYQTRLEVKGLPTGMYYAKLLVEGEVRTAKLMVITN